MTRKNRDRKRIASTVTAMSLCALIGITATGITVARNSAAAASAAHETAHENENAQYCRIAYDGAAGAFRLCNINALTLKGADSTETDLAELD